VIDLDGSVAWCRSLWTEAVKPEKHPDDLARHEIILERVKPRVVVETGLHWGYGARWWAARVPFVLTVERDAQMLYDFHRDTHGFGGRPPNLVAFDGDSLARFDDIADLAVDIAGTDPILVVLDSDHGKNHVLAEMEAYSALVTPGSYMVVEDGIYHYLPPGPRHVGNWYDGDPVQAIEAFLDQHPHRPWEIDHELEDKFPVTLNPSGWLRRT
jgi:cephalosporin hydroxylase